MAKFKYGDSGRGYGPPSGTGVARDRPLSTVLRPAPAGRKKKKKRLPTFRTTAEHFYGDVQRCSGQYMNGYSDIQKKELKITMLVIEMLTALKEQLSWIVWKWKSRRKEHPN